MPQRVLRRVVHTTEEVLPTAVAKAEDHYYLPAQRRMATAREVAATQGVEGAQGGEELKEALNRTRGVTQQDARGMLGGALHIPSARAVAEKTLEGLGWKGEEIRLADVYSGVGTLALAVGQAAGRRVRYVAAAEKNSKARKVLRAAWGREVKIRKEARKAGWGGAKPDRIDIAGVTMPCGPVSKLNGHPPSESALKDRREEMKEVLEMIAEWEPRAVIIESVAELLKGRNEKEGRKEEEVMRRALRGYEIRAQVVKAEERGGVRMRRNRAYWVAIRGVWAVGAHTVH